VDSRDRIVWSSQEWGGGKGLLSDGSTLLYPNNIALMSEDFVVTNRNRDEYIVVDRNGDLKYRGKGDFKHPHNCEPIGNGRFILVDSDRNKILEQDTAETILWEYEGGLLWPRDANRLPNGNTLIGDSKNGRVLEVTPDKRIAWVFQVDYFGNFYETNRLVNENTLISDQQHHRIIEVSPEGRIVWEFRNFRKDVPVFERLTNGYFKKRDSEGGPLDWTLMTRFSEGGGRLSWAANPYGKEVPCLEYDRLGALCLQQAVKARPGQIYCAGLSLATEGLDGSACLQVAFKDEWDGLLCDVTQAPKGNMFSGNTPWTQDFLEVTVPNGAVSADVRVFICGIGRLLFSDVRFQAAQ